MRHLRFLPAFLFSLTYGVAYAQDAGSVASSPATDPINPSTYLLSLGPVGAAIAVGIALGRGVKVSVQVDLAPEDRKLLERLVEAVEQEPHPQRRARA